MARVPIESEPERKPEEEDAVKPAIPESEPEPEKQAGGLGSLLDFGSKKKKTEADKVEPKRGPGRPKGSTNAKSIPSLKKGLQQQFTMIGIAVFAFNQYDGKIILDRQESLAENLCRVAEQNPAVRKALEGMLVAGVWSGLAMSACSIGIPIMANHSIIPPHMATLMGAPDPREEIPEENTGETIG